MSVLRALTIFLLASPALAAESVTMLPASHHQQFLTYGLFIEEGTGLVLRDGGRAWAGLGASIALVEVTAWAWKPQLVLSGTVNASFRAKNGVFDFLTETFDGRFGFAVEFSPRPDFRFSVGLSHASGHAADGVANKDVIPPNLGDDSFVVRAVYDAGTRFRVGATLKPLIDADPPSQSLAAEQFFEWFPLGIHEAERGGTWYVAGGLDESGTQKVDLSWHVQTGFYFGTHLTPEHRPTVRLVLGYYDGWDPRLKYAQFKLLRAHFPYAGIILNL